MVEQLEYGDKPAFLQAVVEALDALPLSSTPFLIVPEGDQARVWRRLLGEMNPRLSFGLTVETFSAYVQNRWELFGDGRSLVDNQTRRLLCAKALADHHASFEGQPLPTTPGVVGVIADGAREGFCHPGFGEAAVRIAQGVSGADVETAVFDVLARYIGLLESANLVEYGDALRALATTVPVDATFICCDFDHPLPAEEAYLNAARATMLRHRPVGVVDKPGLPGLIAHLYKLGSPLEPSSAIRFASAAGVYAEAPLIAKLIEECVATGTKPGEMFVSCAHPSDMFARLAPLLSDAGIAVRGNHTETFATSLLGGAFLALRDVVLHVDTLTRPHAVACLTDFAISPFCRISAEKAYKLDAKMRFDRTLEIQRYVDELGKADGAVAEMADAFKAGHDTDVLKRMYTTGCESGRLDELQMRLAGQALSVGTKLLDAAENIGVDDVLMEALLSREPLNMECCRVPTSEDAPECAGVADPAAATQAPEHALQMDAIRIGTLDDLSRTPCRTAIIAELTAADFPLARKGDPLDALFGKVGIKREDTMLEDVRLRFLRAIDSVSDAVIFERSQSDAEAASVRPSVLFEEVVDCFRPDVTATDDIDEVCALPKQLMDCVVDGVRLHASMGEGDLEAILPRPFGEALGQGDIRTTICTDAFTVDRLSEDEVHRLIYPGGSDPVFSASQVELYMNCPYRWFVLRKLHPDTLDTQNDAIANGSFVHSVMKRFYDSFIGAGYTHVNEDNIDRALAMLDVAFDEWRDNQSEDTQNPMVITNKLEDRLLEELRRRLHGLVSDDASFLKTFAPSRFEYGFGFKEGDEVIYAGHRFRGSVDRIDTDSNGRAVIIDYKGGMGSEYSPTRDKATDELIVSHAQALIYAQIVSRKLDVRIVASLYRSYRNGNVQGIYDPRVVGREDLLDKKPFELGTDEGHDMDAVLNQTENDVAAALERMLSGEIVQRPLSARSCDYCPVLRCPSRKGGAR